MQSETGFPSSSHQLKSYVTCKSRLKLAARCPVSGYWPSCYMSRCRRVDIHIQRNRVAYSRVATRESRLCRFCCHYCIHGAMTALLLSRQASAAVPVAALLLRTCGCCSAL